MGLKGAVALAALLPILLGGCDLFTRYEWHHPGATVAMRDRDEQSCQRQARADAGPPPVEPYRHYPSKKQIRRFESESCSKKCAYRRADEVANPFYDLERRRYDRERSRHDSDIRQTMSTCMAALGYVYREVSEQ